MKIENDELIKKWEQLRLEAYLPTPNDVWTIGWGHTRTAKRGMKITVEQAQALFDKDVAWVEDAIAKHIKVPLEQHQYDAVASWTFNIGEGAMSRSTLVKKLNIKDYQGAADQFLLWDKQKGKVLKGLVRRRKEERDYFLGKPKKPVSPQKAAKTSIAVVSTAAGAALLADHNSLLLSVSGAVVAILIGMVLFKLYQSKKGK